MEKPPTRKSRRLSGQSTPLTIIELQHSRQHRALIVLVHLGAGCLIPWISLPAVYLAITGLFILASLLVTLKNIDRETETISLRQNGDLFMRVGGEAEWHFMDISSAFLSGWLIVLTLSDASGRKQRRLVCFPDSMSRDDFRRLTVFVRLHGPAHIRNSVDVTS